MRLAALDVLDVCISMPKKHSSAYTGTRFIEKIAASVCARRLINLSLAGESRRGVDCFVGGAGGGGLHVSPESGGKREASGRGVMGGGGRGGGGGGGRRALGGRSVSGARGSGRGGTGAPTFLGETGHGLVGGAGRVKALVAGEEAVGDGDGCDAGGGGPGHWGGFGDERLDCICRGVVDGVHVVAQLGGIHLRG